MLDLHKIWHSDAKNVSVMAVNSLISKIQDGGFKNQKNCNVLMMMHN